MGADGAEPRAREAERERRGVALRADEQGDRFGTVLVEDRAQARGDLVDRLIGGNRLQAVGSVALRGEEPIGRVVQLAEMTALRAREATGERVIRVARDVRDAPVFDSTSNPHSGEQMRQYVATRVVVTRSVLPQRFQ